MKKVKLTRIKLSLWIKVISKSMGLVTWKYLLQSQDMIQSG